MTTRNNNLVMVMIRILYYPTTILVFYRTHARTHTHTHTHTHHHTHTHTRLPKHTTGIGIQISLLATGIPIY